MIDKVSWNREETSHQSPANRERTQKTELKATFLTGIFMFHALSWRKNPIIP
jgi:hypothetical protein